MTTEIRLMASHVSEPIHQQILTEVHCDSIITMTSAFSVLYSKGRNKPYMFKKKKAGVLREV